MREYMCKRLYTHRSPKIFPQVSSICRSASRKAFTWSLSTSSVPITLPVPGCIIGTMVSDPVLENAVIAWITGYIIRYYYLFVRDCDAAQSSGEREIGIGRRPWPAPGNITYLCLRHIIQTNPAVISGLADRGAYIFCFCGPAGAPAENGLQGVQEVIHRGISFHVSDCLSDEKWRRTACRTHPSPGNK